MENARLGVSTSKVSSSPSRRTRMYSVPSVKRSWVISSVRFKNEKPVWSDSRMTAVSRCNSARDRSSDQSLSPVVIGRFTTAVTQSSVPAGLKETLPPVYARRATRLVDHHHYRRQRARRQKAAPPAQRSSDSSISAAVFSWPSLLKSAAPLRLAGSFPSFDHSAIHS